MSKQQQEIDLWAAGGYWRQCLPYNEETAKLIGTCKAYNEGPVKHTTHTER